MTIYRPYTVLRPTKSLSCQRALYIVHAISTVWIVDLPCMYSAIELHLAEVMCNSIAEYIQFTAKQCTSSQKSKITSTTLQ